MKQLLTVISSPRLWISIIIFLVILIAIRVMKKLELRTFQKHNIPANSATQIHMLSGIVRYGLLIFAVLAVLQLNNINVTSIVTGLGLVGIIVGFALQDILKDIIMGINIITKTFVRIGDVIDYAGSYWAVTDISIRFLYLKNIDTEEILIVSNRNITEFRVQAPFENLIVPGSYASEAEDMEAVCRDICDAIAKIPGVSQCSLAGIDAFESSQINYVLKVFSSPADRTAVRRQANRIIRDQLATHGLSIPYNQLDVHIEN